MDIVKRQIHYWCRETTERIYLGQNITTAVLDTGLYPHPDFAGRILAFKDYINGRNGLYDDSGHGTHVSGILAGNGIMSKGILAGIAPESRLVALKVLDEKGNGNVSHIEEGIQWIRENKDKYRIKILNLSAGAGTEIGHEKEKILISVVEEVWDMGICVIVSAGNAVNEKEITIPGTSGKIITVGMADCKIYDRQKRNSREKPDVFAPGKQIISCNAVKGVIKNRKRN